MVANIAVPGEWVVDEPPVLTLGTRDAGGPTDFYRVRSITPLPGGGFVVANGGSEELRFFSESGAFSHFRLGQSGHIDFPIWIEGKLLHIYKIGGDHICR